MNARALLFTPGNRLRAPWRILLFFVALLMALAVAIILEGVVETIAAAQGYRPLVRDWGPTLGILVATAISLYWVDGEPWSYVCLGAESARPALLVRSALVGAVAIALPSLLLMATGLLRTVASTPGSWWFATGLTFANLLPAAIGEELFVRGYIFAVLRESVGWRWTLIATSIAFGLLHVPNPGADAESVVIVMLGGFFLGSVLLATRSLYAAIMVHFAWNWVMAAGLHTPVSGIAIVAPDYRIVDNGPDWLTGGSWGPEGGLAAAVSMFAAVVYIYARHLRRMEQ